VPCTHAFVYMLWGLHQQRIAAALHGTWLTVQTSVTLLGMLHVHLTPGDLTPVLYCSAYSAQPLLTCM
jgi:hypothetical protein